MRCGASSTRCVTVCSLARLTDRKMARHLNLCCRVPLAVPKPLHGRCTPQIQHSHQLRRSVHTVRGTIVVACACLRTYCAALSC
jgi:hypothetical protein